MESHKLGIPDFIIIIISLVISVAIGIYFQFSEKNKNNEEYLLAGRQMTIFPVVLSMLATMMSASNVMGIPTDVYMYGTALPLMDIGVIMACILSSYLFLPVYYNNSITTSYQYLELRFGRAIRSIMSLIFGFQMLVYTSLALYAPALALSAVTNLTKETSILVIGTVCMIYSTLGGIKAVLWTDVFQSILMFSCLFAVIIIGSMKVGGIFNVFNIAYDGGRLLIPNFSFDLSAHYTFFNLLFHGNIILFANFSASHLVIQRFLTLPNLKQGRIASVLCAPVVVSFHLLCCCCGIVIYSYFLSCDPITATTKPINAPDQLLPYFIISAMNKYPGLSGLCISGIFSAALSTCSSALNGLAAITSQDFIGLIWPKTIDNILLTKLLSFFYGVLSIALAFSVSIMGNIVQVTHTIFGLCAGSQLGLQILATFTKTTNQEGAIIGVLTSFVLSLFLCFTPRKEVYNILPVSQNCDQNDTLHFNLTVFNYFENNKTMSMLSTTQGKTSFESNALPLGYMWISTFGLLSCLFVGFLSSLVISYFKKNNDPVPDKYLSPVRVWLNS